MSGGCACVPSADDLVNDLSRAMNELRVDLTILTPIVAAFLAPNGLPLLKALVMVGNPMQITLIQERLISSARISQRKPPLLQLSTL
jgi:hypothetical protein